MIENKTLCRYVGIIFSYDKLVFHVLVFHVIYTYSF